MNRTNTVWITDSCNNSFSDDYIKLKQIGVAGAYGKAFKCRRKSDGKILAVKEISKARIYRLSPSNDARTQLLKCMETEIDIMQRLNHQYIVKMHAVYETKHVLHIVMDECKGGELFERIKQKRRYSEHDTKHIIRMICEALFYMHDKHRVVHCDLKPENILFADKSQTSNIKIIDFGMSKILPRLRSANELVGTPYYTAPEVIDRRYSHASDMWSVGVIAYVMIFGFPPFYVKPGKYYGNKELKEIYKLIKTGFNPIIKKSYGAWFPHSLRTLLSKDGMDFMAHLMEKDIAKRLTAKEALKHPWLCSMDRDHDDDNHEGNECKLNLNGFEFAHFAVAHKFKYAMSGLFREQYKNMRPKHFENLKHIFVEMDLDGNGKISYEEFEEGMLKCNDLKLDANKISKIFKELDVSKAGEIEFNALLDAVVHDYLVESDVRLCEAFRELDENETGRLETELLKKKVREMNVYYDDIESILEIIDDVDLDKDGTIDYAEFLQALHPDFNETPDWFWCEGEQEEEDTTKTEEEDSKSDTNSFGEYIESIETAQLKWKKESCREIVKEGWMKKEGKLFKTWKRRYFILKSNGFMSYYGDKTQEKLLGVFSCKQLKELSFMSWGATNEKRYGIKVNTEQRNWKLVCQNNGERKEWMECLQTISK